MTIDELFISLGLKTDGVKKGAKEAESAISGMTSSIVAKLGVLSAGAAAALSIFSRFGEYVAQADAMGKLADALDVDIEKMHAWGEAAARAGGSVEGFQGSLQSLTAQLARQATTGTSRAARLLEGVGIDAGEVGRQRQAFDVMMELAEKAETMGKQEFFGLGRSLGLDQGTIMLLQQGRAALKEQIRLQKEFGVYTKEDAKVTANWNDRVADFGQVMKSFSAIIFRMVLPAMTKFVEYVNKAVAFLRKHEKFVQAFFIGLAAVITGVLLPALAKMAAAWLANPMTLTIMAIVAALALLAAVIEDLVIWANDGPSAFAGLWESLFESPEKAREKWEELKQAGEELFNVVLEYAPKILRAFVSWQNPLSTIVGLFQGIYDAWTFLKDSLQAGIDFLSGKFEAFGKIISDALSPLAQKGQMLTGNAPTGDTGAALEKYGMEADGGIFTKPTKAIIGEAGAEAVIPFSPGKRNRGLELLSKIAGNLMPTMPKIEMPTISAAQALPMGGATTNNNINSDTRVTVGTVNISAADGTDAANQFMTGVETRAAMWTAAANVAY